VMGSAFFFVNVTVVLEAFDMALLWRISGSIVAKTGEFLSCPHKYR